MTTTTDEPALADAFARILASRRSVRGYRPEPLPEPLIRAILAQAQQSPSNCNVQPWQVHLVSGASLTRLAAAMVAEGEAGRLSLELPRVGTYPGIYRGRQVDAAKALFAATGIARDDHAGRLRSTLRNYALFDAPHGLFVFMPREFGVREAIDIGIYAQTFMLAAAARGVATCAQGSLTHHTGVLRDQLGVGPELVCLLGISFGLADEDHPANRASTGRVPVDEAVTFHW